MMMKKVTLTVPINPYDCPHVWSRDWEEQSARLFHLLERIDRGNLEPAMALLDGLRDCRQRLSDPPHAELRILWRQVLDELWEAARYALYCDLGPARTHADSARRRARELQELLAALSM
jgi:hypothetical protein